MTERELWIRFACAALSGVAVDENFNEKTCEQAGKFADEMICIYKDNFGEIEL